MADQSRLIGMYEKLLLARGLDELMIKAFQEGNIPGFVHSGIGQEAITIGALYDARKDDYMLMHHRGFGYQVGKGMDIKKVLAEMCGRATGYSKGKGGFHMADPEVGVLGIGGSVGSCFPLAVGAGLTAQINKKQQVVFCFFGDGTSNRETAASSMNLASVWKLPIIFICENNKWGLTVPLEKSAGNPVIADRAIGYGMPGYRIDGSDVLVVNEEVNKAIERARNGEGPTLIECMTYRWMSHALGYPYYGAEKDAEEGRKNHDPISIQKQRISLSEAEFDSIQAKVDRELDEAYDYAVNSPWPNPEDAYEDLYVRE